MIKSIVSAVAIFGFLIPVAAFADSSTVSISLSGANPQTVYAGSAYVDPGYSAVSSTDGDITASVNTSFVNTSVAGWTHDSTTLQIRPAQMRQPIAQSTCWAAGTASRIVQARWPQDGISACQVAAVAAQGPSFKQAKPSS